MNDLLPYHLLFHLYLFSLFPLPYPCSPFHHPVPLSLLLQLLRPFVFSPLPLLYDLVLFWSSQTTVQLHSLFLLTQQSNHPVYPIRLPNPLLFYFSFLYPSLNFLPSPFLFFFFLLHLLFFFRSSFFFFSSSATLRSCSFLVISNHGSSSFTFSSNSTIKSSCLSNSSSKPFAFLLFFSKSFFKSFTFTVSFSSFSSKLVIFFSDSLDLAKLLLTETTRPIKRTTPTIMGIQNALPFPFSFNITPLPT